MFLRMIENIASDQARFGHDQRESTQKAKS
jgi:hypothetical protein